MHLSLCGGQFRPRLLQPAPKIRRIQRLIGVRRLDSRLVRRRLQPVVQQVLPHRVHVIRQPQQNAVSLSGFQNSAELPLRQVRGGPIKAFRQRAVCGQERSGIGRVCAQGGKFRRRVRAFIQT